MSVAGLKQLSLNSRVSVIGGGISGLSFAYFLGRLRPDVNITVFEKNNRVGGYINTVRATEETIKQTGSHGERALKMERGPRTLRGVSAGTLIIVDMLNKMGKLDQLRGVHVKSEGNRKYILTDSGNTNSVVGEITGELLEVPGPGCSLSTIAKYMSNKGDIMLQAIFQDLFYKKKSNVDNYKNDSVEAFFSRHFGKRMINEVGSALMYGIYAADVANLSSECVATGMVNIEKEGGSIIRTMVKRKFNKEKKENTRLDENVEMYVKKIGSELDLVNLSQLLKKFPMLALKDGLSTLCTSLESNMPPNVSISTERDIKKIEKHDSKIILSMNNDEKCEFDHVRSTIGTLELGKMVDTNNLQKILNEFKYTSVAVCNVLIPKKDVKAYKGFGFLIPKSKFDIRTRLMGVIFDSDVEESSQALFPQGGSSLPEILKTGFNVNRDQKSVTSLVKNYEDTIVAGPGIDDNDECTKVTLMVNIDPNTREEPTLSHIRMIVQETFENLLGSKEMPDAWAIEKAIWRDSIPIYDVSGEGFLSRREQTIKEFSNFYGGNLSLGGMTFARGVGVPDGVVSSLQAAVSLAGEEKDASKVKGI